MKKQLILVAFAGCLCSVLLAQIPSQFNYQAIARDAQTLEPYRDKQLGVEVRILDKNKVVKFSETHDGVKTSGLGVFTLPVGRGNVVIGTTLTDIDWADGPYSLKVDIDPNGGTEYNQSLPANPLVYVPYALYAQEAGSAKIANGSITASALNSMGAKNGQVLIWNNGSWGPVTLSAPPAYTGGTGIAIDGTTITNTAPDLPVAIHPGNNITVAGTYPNFTVNAIGDNWGTETVQHDATLTGSGTSGSKLGIASGVIPTTLPPNGNAGGDLSGAYPNPNVVKIQGRAISNITPSNSQVLEWDASSSSWIPATPIVQTDNTLIGFGTVTSKLGIAPGVIPTTLPPSGPAGGDLTGAYPNPKVVSIQGRSISPTAPTDNQVLEWSAASSSWVPAALPAPVTYTQGTGIAINGNTISNTQPDQVVTISPGANTTVTGSYPNFSINAQGDNWGSATVQTDNTLTGSGTPGSKLGIAPGVIPTTLPPNGNAGGDLSGSYPNPNVAKLQGRPMLSTAPTSGQVLQWNGTDWAPATQTVQHDTTMTGAGTSASPLGVAFSPWKASGTNIYNTNTGKVLIGTSVPFNALNPTQLLNIMSNTMEASLVLAGNSGSNHSSILLYDTPFHNGWSISHKATANNGIDHQLAIDYYDATTNSYRYDIVKFTHDGRTGLGFYYTEIPPSKFSVKGGDVNILDVGSGVIMKSPNGNCWRMTVNNAGQPVFTAITCP